MLYLFSMLIFFAGSANLYAGMHTEIVEYRHGDTMLEGYLAYDDEVKGVRPAVLVVHDWLGVGPYVKKRTEELAKLGYIAFAIDMYGKGVRPENAEEAAAQAGVYRKDRQLMRARANAGLDVLKKHKLTDTRLIAAIGYCFGGGTVLELTR
ncbi:MAG: dienelactone hydrolase family protein, partial [Nitrospirota bacterium]